MMSDIQLNWDFFGPHEDRTFLAIKLDNWLNWSVIASIITTDKFLNSYFSDIIGPWITNSIWDHKTTSLDYSDLQCQIIVCGYYLYFGLKYVFTIYLLINELDFALLRVAADLAATFMTTKMHLRKNIDKSE